MDRTVVVVAGGDPVAPTVRRLLPDAATVIAADSGLDVAAGLGLAVDLVVGDFDSVSPARLEAARAAGAEIERHPVAKDATDLELAMRAAGRFAPARVVVVGGHGGRLDHLLANLLLLASAAFAELTIEAHMGEAHVHVVRDASELTGEPGELVSLLPAHGPARGVTTDGLLYPLRDEDLLPGSTRGVSNELARPRARVSVREGVLLAVQPGALGTHLHADIDPGATP
jgi:thiamine pyrophosphokinase